VSGERDEWRGDGIRDVKVRGIRDVGLQAY
jgi:hypothetical protein